MFACVACTLQIDSIRFLFYTFYITTNDSRKHFCAPSIANDKLDGTTKKYVKILNYMLYCVFVCCSFFFVTRIIVSLLLSHSFFLILSLVQIELLKENVYGETQTAKWTKKKREGERENNEQMNNTKTHRTTSV